MQHFNYDNGKTHHNKKGWNASRKLKTLAVTASAAFMLFATGCAGLGPYAGGPQPNMTPVQQHASQYGTRIDVGGGRVITVPPMPQGYHPEDCTFTFQQSGVVRIKGTGEEQSNNLRESGKWDCRARTFRN